MQKSKKVYFSGLKYSLVLKTYNFETKQQFLISILTIKNPVILLPLIEHLKNKGAIIHDATKY